jgi:biotin operon repressor
MRIEHKISHEELSEMVGTTRPRISKFMQRFRILGLIETSAERFLIIKEKKLADYLAQIINSRTRQADIRLPRPLNLNGELWPSSRDAASTLI